MKLKKKGDLLSSTMGKVIIAFTVLLVVLGLLWVIRGKLSGAWSSLSRIMRFGG